MTKRPERPQSLVPTYMYGGKAGAPATSRFNLRAVLLWVSALVLIGLVSWLYLLQASQVTSYAHEIRTLQLAKDRIRRQNTALRGQVAIAGSLARVREVGQQLGYSLPDAEDATRRMTLVYESAPAAASAASIGGQNAEATGGKRLLDRLAEQLNAWFRSAQPAEGGE